MNENGLAPREDRVIAETSHEEALMNAPSKDSDYFRVPKVLKKSGG
jgi:aspartyl-tRNA(Asn)/glutamyl-tRNA(Gln) amidotransferase subunit C